MKAPTSSASIGLPSLEGQMAGAATYSEWLASAAQHDDLSGASDWRRTEASSLYDHAEIRARRDRLRRHLDDGACHELLYALNEGVHGNMGGMGRPVLYSRARCGTKHLIEDYVATIAEALDAIASCPLDVVSYAEKLDFFRRASHCYGRSALLLSGGAGLIYFHHGMVQELIAQDLLPKVISGASAGSIVASQLGTMADAELRDGHFARKRYLEPTRTPVLDVFLGRLEPAEAKRSRERLLDEIVPKDVTFQEAYEHTGRYINISISPAERHQSSRLMNAITSPNVYIRSAASASSSIPGVMPAERLYAKGSDGKPRPYLASRRWVDGSLSADLPTKRLARLYGVNHFIVSLINPVVVPFVEDVKARPRRGMRTALSVASLRVANELLAGVERLLDRRGTTGNLAASQLAYVISMLEQQYLGDINVLLDARDFRWRQIAFEFREGEIEALIQAGRRRTWPKIAQIRNAALISRTLDAILEELDARAVGADVAAKHHQYL